MPETPDPLEAEEGKEIAVVSQDDLTLALGNGSMEEWIRYEHDGFEFGEHRAQQ